MYSMHSVDEMIKGLVVFMEGAGISFVIEKLELVRAHDLRRFSITLFRKLSIRAFFSSASIEIILKQLLYSIQEKKEVRSFCVDLG